VINGDNTLDSRAGYYYSESKDLHFIDSVVIVNPDYTIYADTLKYQTDSEVAHFFGPTQIISPDNYIYCENGWYDTRKNISQFNENVYYVPELGKAGISFDLQQGIYQGNNSGCGALMLAVALGCKKIGLLGYDFQIQQNGARVQTHWHDGYDRGTIRNMVRNLEKFRDCIEELGPCILEAGVSVYNLNPDSGLRCFEKISLDSFLSGD